MRRRAVLVSVLLPFALAACGEGVSGVRPGDGKPAPSYAPDDLVARVRHVGGFLPEGAQFGALPQVAVYGDGRVVTVGPTTAIYPGAALPNLLVARMEPELLARVVSEGVAAGVDGTARDYGQPPVADAGAVEVTLRTGGRLVSVRAEALGIADDSATLTPAQREARRTLSAYVGKLTGLEQWLGDGTVSEETSYAFDRLGVLARSYSTVSPDPAVQPNELRWTGPDLTTGTAMYGGTCLVAGGAGLDLVRPDLPRATTITRWTTADGKAWHLLLRPLLPDEDGCADLDDR